MLLSWSFDKWLWHLIVFEPALMAKWIFFNCSNIQVDLNINNTVGIANTQLLGAYSQSKFSICLLKWLLAFMCIYNLNLQSSFIIDLKTYHFYRVIIIPKLEYLFREICFSFDEYLARKATLKMRKAKLANARIYIPMF